jgi:hypothetical protein
MMAWKKTKPEKGGFNLVETLYQIAQMMLC